MIHAEAKLTEYRKHEGFISFTVLCPAEKHEVATPSWDGDPNTAKTLQVWLLSRTRKQFLQPRIHAVVKRKSHGAKLLTHHKLRLLGTGQVNHFRVAVHPKDS
jgi:hypothetical protein